MNPSLTRAIEESVLCAIEDALDRPARVLTPARLKFSDCDEGTIITLLAFEAKVDD